MDVYPIRAFNLDETAEVIQQQLAEVGITVDLWHQLDEEVTTEAPSGFIVFTADVGGYNTTRIGDMQAWPLGNCTVPDPWVSYIKG